MRELTARAISPAILSIGRYGKMACIPLAAKSLRARRVGK